MAYPATVLRALISCPSDVAIDDVRGIQTAIGRWNVLLGERFGAIVVPVHWSEHAAAAFGAPPQDILNEQLVDTVDFGIAVFWSRLGSPTQVAESGTAEEINRIAAARKPLSVLRCTRPAEAVSVDPQQLAGLAAYLDELRGHALILSYRDDAELASRVDTVLTRTVAELTKGDGDAPPPPRAGSDGQSMNIHDTSV